MSFSQCCWFRYWPDSKSVEKKGSFRLLNKHPEWIEKDRTYKWYVNEIECEHKKKTWCSDEFIEFIESMETLRGYEMIKEIKNGN